MIISIWKAHTLDAQSTHFYLKLISGSTLSPILSKSMEHFFYVVTNKKRVFCFLEIKMLLFSFQSVDIINLA